MKNQPNQFGFERPLDLLNSCKGKHVNIYVKDKDKPLTGILMGFDIHINVAYFDSEIKQPRFIRGDMITMIEPTEDISNGKKD